ncbi:MAG: carbohydrate kinase family protein [Anaerolineae bacterium]
MYDAIVAGHLCLDLFPDLSTCVHGRFDSILQPGRLTIVGPIEHCTGGPVSNTGLALSRLGICTGLMGKVGDDPFGQIIRRYVRERNAVGADALVVDPAAHSSYTLVFSVPNVDRMFLHYPGANDTFSCDDVRYDLVAGARLFHFGYPPLMRRMYEDGGHELASVFSRAKETGVTTSLDMAFPDPTSPAWGVDWARILRRTLPYVDLFLPSIEETLFMLCPTVYEALQTQARGQDILPLIRPEMLSDLGRECIGLGAKIVAFKLGYRGLYLRTAGRQSMETLGRGRPADPAAWSDREFWAPCFQVEVVGTTGSGDATIAGLLAGLLRGLSPEDSVTAAVAVGACNVEAADALGGLRSWDETWQRVRSGWARRELVLDAPGWVLTGRHQLWAGPCETSGVEREL